MEQAYLFHHALTDPGVETELVVYSREPHGAWEFGHVRDLNRRIIECSENILRSVAPIGQPEGQRRRTGMTDP